MTFPKLEIEFSCNHCRHIELPSVQLAVQMNAGLICMECAEAWEMPENPEFTPEYAQMIASKIIPSRWRIMETLLNDLVLYKRWPDAIPLSGKWRTPGD